MGSSTLLANLAAVDINIAGLIGAAYSQAQDEDLSRFLSIDPGSGGTFYLTQAARAGKRFSRALIASTLEGQTLFRDAFRMLDLQDRDVPGTRQEPRRGLSTWPTSSRPTGFMQAERLQALRRIRERHAPLAQHLDRTIRTGSCCVEKPAHRARLNG
jgi:hypothetical protein